MGKRNTTINSIPNKREISPDYAALLDRLDALRSEQRNLLTDARALEASVRSNNSTGIDTARESRALEIIEGQPVAELESDIARLKTVYRRIGDLDAAIALLSQKLDVESRRASGVIVKQVAKTHTDLVATICTALIAAHHANRQYHALTDALNLDGVAWTSLHPMQPNKLFGDPRDRYSNLACYLHEAVDFGFIDANTVPGELRR